jgi:N-acetylneuraminic acid mutarotase
LLYSGQVLVVGGIGDGYGPNLSAELYDPSTNTWTPVGNAQSHGAVGASLLFTGQVLVTGGADVDNRSSSAVSRYTP